MEPFVQMPLGTYDTLKFNNEYLKRKLKEEQESHSEDVAQAKLVERATPKKLVATRHTRRCPSCNRQMSDIDNAHPNMKFCPNCGQALDWEIRR